MYNRTNAVFAAQRAFEPASDRKTSTKFPPILNALSEGAGGDITKIELQKIPVEEIQIGDLVLIDGEVTSLLVVQTGYKPQVENIIVADDKTYGRLLTDYKEEKPVFMRVSA